MIALFASRQLTTGSFYGKFPNGCTTNQYLGQEKLPTAIILLSCCRYFLFVLHYEQADRRLFARNKSPPDFCRGHCLLYKHRHRLRSPGLIIWSLSSLTEVKKNMGRRPIVVLAGSWIVNNEVGSPIPG
ncbi:hypothetical protein RRG08_056157 [Elysia crispata]|uniref:Uncharacterized protein n=1 Tax=Elysia crispata TaxID=231223 RepID=A0AAE0YRQ1_9GAST|nr:hypothetical protein RRG08_056157 [Elysia crispata]